MILFTRFIKAGPGRVLWAQKIFDNAQDSTLLTFLGQWILKNKDR